MHLGLFFRILASRFGLIFSIFAITLVSAAIASFTMSKVYTASAVVFVDVKSLDPVLGGTVYSPQTVRGQLATQVEIIESDRVVHAVIQALEIDKDPDVMKAWASTDGSGNILSWLSGGIRERLKVTPSNEGSTMTISFEDWNPTTAADFANAFARQYIDATLSLRTAPAEQSAAYFEEQVASYRERLQAAQARMSAFHQSSGIVGTDERVDVENQRLQELSSQLVLAQAAAAESRSRRDVVARQGRDSMPEVVTNSLIQTMKSELGRAEGRLEDLSSRLGRNHPQYLSAQAEIDTLRARLNAEVNRVSSSILAASSVNIQREAEIRAAYETQRARVLRLRKDRDQLRVLESEVAGAQRALDLVSERLTRTNLESKSPQSNISILSPALTPSKPSRPQPVLNMIVGGFVGLVLGLLAALSIEAFKRPVRTADDLLRAAAVPVLAVLPPSGSRRAQRLIGNTGPVVNPNPLRLSN